MFITLDFSLPPIQKQLKLSAIFCEEMGLQLIYLSSHSPVLAPIEKVFSGVKRIVGEVARESFLRLWQGCWGFGYLGGAEDCRFSLRGEDLAESLEGD